ncbi:MAG: hypothetical protein ACYDCQ_18055 [Dehalococcoidia bacterium]
MAVSWPDLPNEHGGRMLWFGSWLAEGVDLEAGWFYSGRGGVRDEYRVPVGAAGLRIRRWPNEGLDPEYVDVLDFATLSELRPDELDFDVQQRFSRLG